MPIMCRRTGRRTSPIGALRVATVISVGDATDDGSSVDRRRLVSSCRTGRQSNNGEDWIVNSIAGDSADRPPVDDWTPTERISWFPVPKEEELDPRVAELVRLQREKIGGPNNVVRCHAWRPELMLKWLDLYDYIAKGPSGLTRVEREMIGVVVSADNRCML
jgi:hypothetical protein